MIHSMLMAAARDWEPTGCGSCGLPLEDERMACLEVDRAGSRLVLMAFHPACSTAHDPEWSEVPRPN